jgi:hypothetical protein
VLKQFAVPLWFLADPVVIQRIARIVPVLPGVVLSACQSQTRCFKLRD